MVYSSLSLCSPSSTVKELNLVRKSDDHNSCLRWWELISMRDRCWWTDEWWWSRRINLQISKQLLVNKSDQWKDGWMDKLDGSRSEWLIELMMKWMNACCSMHGDRRNVQLTKDAWTIDRSNERHDRRHRQRHTRPTATLSVVVLCGFRTRFTSSWSFCTCLSGWNRRQTRDSCESTHDEQNEFRHNRTINWHRVIRQPMEVSWKTMCSLAHIRAFSTGAALCQVLEITNQVLHAAKAVGLCSYQPQNCI